MTATTLTDAVVDLAWSLRADAVTAPVEAAVGRAMLDFAACALAGSADEEAAAVSAWAAGQGAGDATVIGTPRTASVTIAALANGAAGHALDYDDYSVHMFHPSVCLLPPVLALGQRHRRSGSDAVLAYLTGFEVGARLARVMNPGHYRLGWHGTSTIGTIAAAVAAARMRGLTPEQTRHAVGAAASSAGGLRSNFGSTVKPLHAGLAAMHGTLAAELAAAGIEADHDALDGSRGFVSVFSGGTLDAAEVTRTFLDGPLELVATGIATKPYACCGALTTGIEALLRIVAAHGLRPEDVERIDCTVRPTTRDIVPHTAATTPAEGRFSIEYALAVALLDGDAGVAQFTPERVADPAVQECSTRVHVALADLPGPSASPAVVEVRTRDGRSFAERIDVQIGRRERPMPTDALVAKFHACAAPLLGAQRRTEVLGLIAALPTLADVGTLAAGLGT